MGEKRNTVTIEGVEYPLCQNVDALCLFEDISGKDYTQIRVTSIRDTSLLFWCMAKAGSERSGMEFPLSYAEFRRAADTETITAWFTAQAQGQPEEGDGGQKKSPSRSARR